MYKIPQGEVSYMLAAAVICINIIRILHSGFNIMNRYTAIDAATVLTVSV